ncbi:hypothetical protein Athai_20000 [Actinocatenispora thailandica]|uniref:DUF11 domain-containing protein n=1 Tax=Actinocatenispora thailandica TaxID=227318 RepID=A0A7R7DMU7_9ACTN|nr:hypothetical protein [Actinocatenispora thailandica]BCJ34497.1 hypothetical protein Athai_20000 [Actinocatenispora thailandica]
MPDAGPDDDRELRAAFDSLRDAALHDLPAPGADAVRQAARHRRRVHQIVAAAAAGLVLVLGGGGALLATQRGHSPQQVTAASSPSTAHPTTPAPSATSSLGGTAGPSEPTGDSGSGGTPTAGSGTLAVSVGSGPATTTGPGHDTQLTVTVRNTGTEPIANAVVVIQPPDGLSVHGDSPCDANGCQLGTLHDLAPGAERAVTGTLSYLRTFASAAPPAGGTVTVTAQDEQGGTVGTVSQPFQVDAGASPTPSGAVSPSEPPSSPSPSPTPNN